MNVIIGIIVALHGFIHFMGFVKAFNFAAMEQLKLPVSRFSGVLWFLAAVLFIGTLALVVMHREGWWIPAIPAIILSQVLIIRSWQDAKYGTIANLIILIPVIISAMDLLPSSYASRYKTDVLQRLTSVPDGAILNEVDIKDLPAPVMKYLHYVGAVGKPKVHNFRAVFTGRMRMKPDAKWMKIKSQQYNFYDDPARLFYLRAAFFGIPFDGFHRYAGDHAIMLTRVANLYPVADARGEKMDQGETVTMFNDMCLLAPASMTSPQIKWTEISSTMVKAVFTNKGKTISATLFFNEEGALINFISFDRFMSPDGKSYLNYPWSTPVGAYREVNGRKVPLYGEAIWHTPEGSFAYAWFDIREIEYNVTDFK